MIKNEYEQRKFSLDFFFFPFRIYIESEYIKKRPFSKREDVDVLRKRRFFYVRIWIG